jgi:hypothetical protein
MTKSKWTRTKCTLKTITWKSKVNPSVTVTAKNTLDQWWKVTAYRGSVPLKAWEANSVRVFGRLGAIIEIGKMKSGLNDLLTASQNGATWK